jgi:hypothetical protein
VMTARCFVLLSLLVSVVGWSVSAMATEGDVFAKDVEYYGLTYNNPPHPSICGIPLDINITQVVTYSIAFWIL